MDLESLVGGLRVGITAAAGLEVVNDRSQIQQVLTAISDRKGGAKIKPEHEAALAEIQTNVSNGASMVSNKRANLLAMLEVFDSLKSARTPELLKD